MNLLKSLLILISFSCFVSCSKKDDAVVTNDLEGFTLVTTLNNNTHKIELYTTSGKFQTGYNEIYVRIKNAQGNTVNNATITWTPTMHMMGMTHSCPASTISKNKGYIVFQMAGTEEEYWDLKVNYTIDDVAYTVTDTIQVAASAKRVVETFQGSDNNRYVLALVNPVKPAVAVNDISAVLYKMESMTSFVVVNNYTIKIDPRMTGMGNHTSPNNVNLTQGTAGMYYGKLSLTMTGYWKINLQLADATQTIIKGEAVTDTNEGSSIYFELEF
ncbi:hypothetical protein [Chitinophaga sancti]|uniref:YtkA-like n=1 Tax=Chitinophaga sancti TaxID=1004 RepID=A0A1K1MVD1_9BACT|nr:hypothetical protein [Chitinophaga sancti]WQD63019.1 hypothetical protein U0033_01335 [Chitinophaga sancti]WQG91356.1 hypothetical protein SR876_07580 [Chitinophaga sancti]SFW27025.1 hypothetical protein SAMN05661012_00921 [Chitinophaga sancti]